MFFSLADLLFLSPVLAGRRLDWLLQTAAGRILFQPVPALTLWVLVVAAARREERRGLPPPEPEATPAASSGQAAAVELTPR